jgi:hypothetical protein
VPASASLPFVFGIVAYWDGIVNGLGWYLEGVFDKIAENANP